MSEDTISSKEKWIGGVLATLVAGGIIQAILTYTQLQVLGERTSTIQEDVKELKESTKETTKDRWTRSDHLNYASITNSRMKVLEGKVVGIETEQARRSTSVWRVDKLSNEIDALKTDIVNLREMIREHEVLRGHPEAEQRLQKIEDRLRKLENR